MGRSQLSEMRSLEKENARLKKIVAEAERGNPNVVLVIALAAILAFTQNNTAALMSEDGGRVLLVTGARNRRYLHLDYARI